MTRDERAHNLAEALAAYDRFLDIMQANTVSVGSELAPAEAEEARVLGDIIERAAARNRALKVQENGAEEPRPESSGGSP